MRLVFVHGMRQEGKDPIVLRDAWISALHDAWSEAGLAPPRYELDMPFYGDELDRLTREARGSSRVVAKGNDPAALSQDEQRMLAEYASKLNLPEKAVDEQLSAEVRTRGPENWEVTQAIARALERRFPITGVIALDFVRQVEAYLTRGHITEKVDEIVRPMLLNVPSVVVAHSLGTVISYWLLRKAGLHAQVPLFVTLGSPLGIGVVKQRVQPPKPLAKPEGISRWLNATDDRDPVALYARLDSSCFSDGIDNISDVRNSRADPHSVVEYLSDRRVAKSIFHALTS